MKGNPGDPGQRGLPGKDGSPGDPGEEGTPGQQVNKINGTNMTMVRSQPIYHSILKFCWKGSSKNAYLRSNYILSSNTVWQLRAEIEYYSVANFDCVTVFKAQYLYFR